MTSTAMKSESRVAGENAGREWRERFAYAPQLARLRARKKELFIGNDVVFSTAIVRLVLGDEFNGSADVTEFWWPLVDNTRQLAQIVNREYASGFITGAVETA